jgi:adenylylsulfate kinase
MEFVMKVIWFTGLSGSGKTTIAEALASKLDNNLKTVILDGDVMRQGLCDDLGFDCASRQENIRRLTEVAKLFCEHGHYVLVPAITPYEQSRARARRRIGDEDFLLVHVATPLEVCEGRDVKGLYARARAGEIPRFTGIDSPFHTPEQADLTIDTTDKSIDECVNIIISDLKQRWAYQI